MLVRLAYRSRMFSTGAHKVCLQCTLGPRLTPTVVGGTGFIISSTMIMIEVQDKWWLPKLNDIGWHGTPPSSDDRASADQPVGFWNLIGAIGFTLCGALGYSSDSRAVYQSDCSTFWGSWAFLIGSGIQVVESVWREAPPDSEKPDAPKIGQEAA